jgi:MFS family permease
MLRASMTLQIFGPRAVLALRDFRLFTSVTFLTAVQQQMQSVAVGWDLYERTGSAMALGWVGLAQFIPVILFFLPAGQLADRHDRRLLLVGSQVLLALCSLGLALAAHYDAPVIWMYVSLFVAGVAQVINRPSRDALQSQIVPAPLLANSVALNSSVFQVASIGGPGLGGVLIAWSGSAYTVYLINLGMAALAMVLAFSIRARPRTGKRPGIAFDELFAGLVHVWKRKLILGALAVDLFAVLFAGAGALLPVFAKDILHVGPVGLGWLSSAAALGSLSMGLVQGLKGRPYEHAGKAFLWAVSGYGVATVVFGMSANFAVSFAALVLAGALDNMSVVLRHTMVQLYTPDELRGRVSAVNRVFVDSSNHLGALRAGALATFASPMVAVVAGGVITVLVTAAAVKMFPELRNLERLGG